VASHAAAAARSAYVNHESTDSDSDFDISSDDDAA